MNVLISNQVTMNVISKSFVKGSLETVFSHSLWFIHLRFGSLTTNQMNWLLCSSWCAVCTQLAISFIKSKEGFTKIAFQFIPLLLKIFENYLYVVSKTEVNEVTFSI